MKSWVFIRVERGGFVVGEREEVGGGGGWIHEDGREDGVRVPMIWEGGKVLVMREEAWISLYATDASLPACLCITRCVSCRFLCEEKTLTAGSAWMLVRIICQIVYRIIDY